MKGFGAMKDVEGFREAVGQTRSELDEDLRISLRCSGCNTFGSVLSSGFGGHSRMENDRHSDGQFTTSQGRTERYREATNRSMQGLSLES